MFACGLGQDPYLVLDETEPDAAPDVTHSEVLTASTPSTAPAPATVPPPAPVPPPPPAPPPPPKSIFDTATQSDIRQQLFVF